MAAVLGHLAKAAAARDEGMTTEPPRTPKKTEMIEVRVSHETKREFLIACREAGRSASDVVRDGIQDFIDRRKRPSFQVPAIRAQEKRPILTMIPKPIRKKRYLAAGAAGIVGLSLLAVMPSAAAPDSQAMFRRLDTNGDGVLSQAEFSSPPGKEMKQSDLRLINQGGVAPQPAGKEGAVFLLPADPAGQAVALQREVSHQSLSTGTALSTEDRRKADFANYDANRDGKITAAEYSARLRDMMAKGFARLDANQDGALDANEYASIGASLLILPANTDTTLPTAAKFGPLAAPAVLESNFKALDANKDGKLSLQEYLPKS